MPSPCRLTLLPLALACMFACVGSWVSSGCAALRPVPPPQRVSPETLLKLPASALDRDRMEWTPNAGRMSPATRRRHLPSDSRETVLWGDRFDLPDGRLPGDWTVTGKANIRSFQLNGEIGTEIVVPSIVAPSDSSDSPHNAGGAGGLGGCLLERRLVPDALRGREVRLSLEMACPSAKRLEALRRVRITLVGVDRDGKTIETLLPLTAEISPGWETFEWWLRFGSGLRDASFRVELPPDAGVILRRSAMTRSSNDPSAPAVASGANLIAGGNFETSRRTFFASRVHSWPNGDQTATPLAFEYDNDAAVGTAALKLRIAGGTGRIGFGPLDLNRAVTTVSGAGAAAKSLYLKLHARSARRTVASVSLRTVQRTLDSATFVFDAQWQTFAHEFHLRTGDARPAELACAELIVDIPAVGDEPLECLLDAVSLTDTPIEAYYPAEPIEVGITGPAPLTNDLANIVAEDEPVLFTVDLVADRTGKMPVPHNASPISHDATASVPHNATTGPENEAMVSQGADALGVEIPGPAGKLALDILDAWDRVVWTRTDEPMLSGEGTCADQVSLRLPRGYYRLLATLWSSEPGESRLISQDSSAVAVVSFNDPVPLGNRYGLSAENENVSGYTTALGAGWVRLDLAARRIETGAGTWDFHDWRAGVSAAKQADVELLAAVSLPATQRWRRPFLEQLLADSPLQPIGLVVDPPTISTRSADEYRSELEWIAEVLAAASPHGRVVADLSALEDSLPQAGDAHNARSADPADNARQASAVDDATRPAGEATSAARWVVGYASTEGPLPEQSEFLLEGIARRFAENRRVWDLAVPARIGGNRLGGSRPDDAMLSAASLDEDEPVSLLDPPLDPALSASRMIRSILLRALAGAQLVCSEATALEPPRSVCERGRSRLHEFDLVPRPALVAFERMTSLLNDASLVRWMDQPDGCRILEFEKDDGGAVAVIWRPFGLSPTFLSFAGLPSNIDVLDTFGVPEPMLMSGNLRLIAANEMVRYVVAAPGQAALLAEAVAAARVRPGPPQSQPDR